MITTLEEFSRPLLLTIILLVLLAAALLVPIAKDIWYVWRVWIDERKRNGED